MHRHVLVGMSGSMQFTPRLAREVMKFAIAIVLMHIELNQSQVIRFIRVSYC